MTDDQTNDGMTNPGGTVRTAEPIQLRRDDDRPDYYAMAETMHSYQDAAMATNIVEANLEAWVSPARVALSSKGPEWMAVWRAQQMLRLSHHALGLTSEAGEVAGKIKKLIRDKQGELTDADRDELIKELGDVLWYAAALANGLDVTLSEVARRNLKKLYSRKARGVLQGSGDNR